MLPVGDRYGPIMFAPSDTNPFDQTLSRTVDRADVDQELVELRIELNRKRLDAMEERMANSAKLFAPPGASAIGFVEVEDVRCRIVL